MFWTAFIWGLGISCSVVIMLIVFMFLKAGIEWFLGSNNMAKEVVSLNRESLARLTERNGLAGEMLGYARRITIALEEHTKEDE